MKKLAIAVVVLFGLGALSPAMAHDRNNAAVAILLGGVAGAAIGSSVGGDNAAVLGSVVGAAVGYSVANDGHRYYDGRRYYGPYRHHYRRPRVVREVTVVNVHRDRGWHRGWRHHHGHDHDWDD